MNNTLSPDLDDPVIDEVRAYRQKTWDECDHDWQKYFERLRKIQENPPVPAPVVSPPPKPVRRT